MKRSVDLLEDMIQNLESLGVSRHDIPKMAQEYFVLYDNGRITREGVEWALRVTGPQHYKGRTGLLHYAAKIALIGNPTQVAGKKAVFGSVDKYRPVEPPIGCGGNFGFCLWSADPDIKDVLWRGVSPAGYDFSWNYQYSRQQVFC